MKTNKFLTLILSFVAVIAITSCVEDDDFTVPSSLGNEENAALVTLLETSTEVDMTFVQGLYTSGTAPEQITADIYVKGYVSSSDATGNFYKEFYMQDAPANPTKALKLIVSQSDSYNQFNKGREVFINLKGLYVGEERVGNGVYTIGGAIETDQFGTTVEQLDENQVKTKILRSGITADMIPLSKTFSTINGSNVGMLVSVDNVEFADNLAGKAYFDPTETYDTQRTMQACEGLAYATFQLETSSFASFKQEPLPIKNGTIAAVVTKTFDGSQVILALNSINDVNFTDARCSLLDPTDFTEIFSEDFETMAANQSINANGWTNYIEAGNRDWRVVVTTDSGNPGSQVASFGAYNSGDVQNISWLITPGVDLETSDYEFLSFETSNSFSDGSELELYISTDWNGVEADVAIATWTPLSGSIVSDATFYQDWISSGSIDLSSYSGTAHIAFKYVGGGDAGIDGTYELDNVSIVAN
ncbi:MAG: choice-of-anchor J domain-containing protein [Bizionia sp.]|nr:choice-of-anchor J domain-containing protein [Bizionia sp.]